eukprot:7391340-Prymnesium_polylepis.2
MSGSHSNTLAIHGRHARCACSSWWPSRPRLRLRRRACRPAGMRPLVPYRTRAPRSARRGRANIAPEQSTK